MVRNARLWGKSFKGPFGCLRVYKSVRNPCLLRPLSQTHLGAVHPCCWTETKAVAHGVDEDEGNADGVGEFVHISRVQEGEEAVDLDC